jgi:phosphatidylserine decarboxylase
MVFRTLILIMAVVMAGLYLFWRYVWFFRNPERRIPQGEQILSPADGTVVYAERVAPDEPLISIKKGKRLFVSDIVRGDVSGPKYHIGIFMSPFDVHFNRAPLSGVIDFIRHHPPKRKNLHMSSMHWRTLRKRLPIYKNSPHILENERTVTRISGHFKGDPVSCYVVQIAGGSVNGIDTFVPEGDEVRRGQIFGMIRIGSQLDTVVGWRETMSLKVKPGDKVKAGQTVLID